MQVNLAVAKGLGIRGIKVSDAVPFVRALSAAVGAIAEPSVWSLDEAQYIASKNKADAAAISKPVVARLEKELAALRTR
jgi:hypothetical protein